MTREAAKTPVSRKTKNKKPALTFRSMPLGPSGLPVLGVEMEGKGLIDWNAFKNSEKDAILTRLNNAGHSALARRLRLMEALKTADEPIANAIYQCNSCGHVTWAVLLDSGVTPLHVTCDSCKSPLASSVGIYARGEESEEVSLIIKNRLIPKLIFRRPTEDEFHSSKVELKAFFNEGGLLMDTPFRRASRPTRRITRAERIRIAKG